MDDARLPFFVEVVLRAKWPWPDVNFRVTQPADFVGVQVDVNWPHREGERVHCALTFWIETGLGMARVTSGIESTLKAIAAAMTKYPRITKREYLEASGVPDDVLAQLFKD